MKSSEWGNDRRVEEGIVWRKYRLEETCKKNVLKGYTNWKYGTDWTCAGAIEKVKVASAGNTDAPSGCPLQWKPRTVVLCCRSRAILNDTGYLHMSPW